MIVSHKHRYIFFAVPKTATQSIRRALQANLGPEDWQQHAMFGRSLLPIPALASLGHGHVSLQQVTRHLAPEQLYRYYKFAFVRHPFDRFISAATFLLGDEPDFQHAPTDVMKRAMSRSRFRSRVLITPQADLLTNSSGNTGMDYIGRYESLQEDFDHVLNHIGLPKVALSVTNTSEHAGYQAYLDDELTSQLVKFYAQDFALFEYST